MSFIADQQTLDDLNVLGKYKSNSIFSLFNQVKTGGGEKLLENMFHHPLVDPVRINQRSRVFKYFQHQNLVFPFVKEEFALMEDYLHEEGADNKFVTGAQILRKQLLGTLLKDEQYERMLAGIHATIAIVKTLSGFMQQLAKIDADQTYLDQILVVEDIFKDPRLKGVFLEQAGGNLSFSKVVKYDQLFRASLKQEMRILVHLIYHLDVYMAVSQVSRSKSFSYAEALPKEKNLISAKELRHPGLDKGVANPVTFRKDSNLVFLTGANMAGKSTFMKTFGISMYLAHMGFPVAAREMVFSVKDGIYSSINVPDNLNLGYSHFYAEVLRVKKVAEEVSKGKHLVVIFDELFKGTNVKDAYDATLAVTTAFAEYRNCVFIISTHIIEVGEALNQLDHLQFLYLPTVMDGSVPVYTYKLQKGITKDRQGMMIIENEGILDIIRSKKK